MAQDLVVRQRLRELLSLDYAVAFCVHRCVDLCCLGLCILRGGYQGVWSVTTFAAVELICCHTS